MKKLKEILKNDWVFFSILAVSLILIIMISTYCVSIENKLYAKGGVQEPTGNIEKIEQGTQIVQKFYAVDNNLEKVIIDFEPYKEETGIGGKINVGIKDEQGNIIKQDTISRNYIREKTKYTLKFDRQKDSNEKEYQIFIQFNDKEKYDKFYSVKITNNNEFKNNKLYVDENELEGTSLIFQDLYKSKTRVTIYSVVMSIMTLGVIVASLLIYYKKVTKIENIFLLIVPFVCLMFMITMPIFRNHDEYYHWFKAYEVSQGTLITPIKEDGTLGSFMPNGVYKILYDDWYSATYKELKEKTNVDLEKDNKVIVYPDTAAVYSFVQYIPQALGIAIARIFTSNVLVLTYAGRMMNMLVAIGLIYLAIKIMPFGKKLFLVPAMIPATLEGVSSLSPDAMTISMAFLYFAYIMYLSFGKIEKIQWKERIILLVMSVIVALCKIVYLPLVGLMLIIPKEKFKDNSNKNKIITFIIIALIATIANLTWLGFSSRYLVDFREGDSKVQVLLAIKNPIRLIQTGLYSVDFYGNNHLTSLFGATLGWGETIRFNTFVPYGFLIIYLVVALFDNEIKDKFKPYQIFWLLAVALLIIGLVYASLYVQWTTIGSPTIDGIQGRYFLPIIPIIMMILGSTIKVRSLYKEENINKAVAISMILLEILVISKIVIVHL